MIHLACKGTLQIVKALIALLNCLDCECLSHYLSSVGKIYPHPYLLLMQKSCKIFPISFLKIILSMIILEHIWYYTHEVFVLVLFSTLRGIDPECTILWQHKLLLFLFRMFFSCVKFFQQYRLFFSCNSNLTCT